MTYTLLNQKSPLLSVSEWVQGQPVTLEQVKGRVVLIDVFQVNCPGCFLYALPEAIRLHQRYASEGLVVLGISTAFEDFDKNTIDNLKRLLKNGEVIGETHRSLTQQGVLINGCLPYRIPFAVAMDRLIKQQYPLNAQSLQTFINERYPTAAHLSAEQQTNLKQQIASYLASLDYRAETFERFKLSGTPSHILIDKQGIIRHCEMGTYPELENDIRRLLQL